LILFKLKKEKIMTRPFKQLTDKMSFERQAQIEEQIQEELDTMPIPNEACPCLHTTPCDPQCTCVNSNMSAGCLRCCSYGSPEQQELAARHLAKLIDAKPHSVYLPGAYSPWDYADADDRDCLIPDDVQLSINSGADKLVVWRAVLQAMSKDAFVGVSATDPMECARVALRMTKEKQ
jgi:hypothetical protein